MEDRNFDENLDPIFEIQTLDTGKNIKIYLDGRVDGFGEEIKVFNLIPAVCDSKRARSNHDILLNTAKALAKVITDNGWDLNTFYSDTELKSFASSGEHSDTKYFVKRTFFSSSSSPEK